MAATLDRTKHTEVAFDGHCQDTPTVASPVLYVLAYTKYLRTES